MEKVIRNGKVAILYSPGFGAGWYTWNKDHKECIFHPKIVELVENNKHSEITEELCEELFKDKNFYLGGKYNLEIEWLWEGTHFIINEYDGSESITLLNEVQIIA